MTCERTHLSNEYDVFAGRGRDGTHLSPDNRPAGVRGWLGNPYPVSDYGREKCIELFERDLEWMIDDSPVFRAAIKSLYGKTLGCHCLSHEDCHAEVIASKANELYWEDMNEEKPEKAEA